MSTNTTTKRPSDRPATKRQGRRPNAPMAIKPVDVTNPDQMDARIAALQRNQYFYVRLDATIRFLLELAVNKGVAMCKVPVEHRPAIAQAIVTAELRCAYMKRITKEVNRLNNQIGDILDEPRYERYCAHVRRDPDAVPMLDYHSTSEELAAARRWIRNYKGWVKEFELMLVEGFWPKLMPKRNASNETKQAATEVVVEAVTPEVTDSFVPVHHAVAA